MGARIRALDLWELNTWIVEVNWMERFRCG
jgi:hypothetical protein